MLICVTTTLLRARSTTRTFAFDLDAYLAYTLAEQPALIAWRPHTSVMGS